MSLGIILNVDDESKGVKLARDYLERAGFVVHSAGDGPRALVLARESRPGLFALDLNLLGLGLPFLMALLCGGGHTRRGARAYGAVRRPGG